MSEEKRYGADLIVDSLINHGVDYVFGIPGAKIDRVFEKLEHPTNPKAPKLIVARHEQNASFMASGIGRITGKPGVVITTSGPGASNLATGLVTANAEGDPVLAISGQVKRADLLRSAHQSMKNADLFAPITKYSAEVQDPDNVSEIIANAYQAAESGKQGASFVSVPQDVTDARVTSEVIRPMKAPKLGPASPADMTYLARQIKDAQLPVLLLGMRASSAAVTKAIRELLSVSELPVVETFQGAGIISADLEDNFFGRVGLFRNQPGDQLLQRSDLVITIGYDPVEYEPRNWNADGKARIVVIDQAPAEIDHNFQPETELIGDIAQTLEILTPLVRGYQVAPSAKRYLQAQQAKLQERDVPPAVADQVYSHPLSIVAELQKRVTDHMTVAVDVGSFYIWIARHFRSYQPRRLLFSNGMQTLGVALPWAIAATLVRPNEKAISISGDGGFLFSGQELETAVRLHANLVHIIWNDGHYDMVKFQEEMKYGHSAGVNFGPVDFVKYAESFGAKGLRVEKPEQLGAVLDEAFATDGPVVVDIPVDYSDNLKLSADMLEDQF
ncbi:acetolactate synthase AlsS [Lacticaseibacillus manihotivorans]|uniref:Acetolactate synthase n=2 Tax=Lacticaseibacillus manihotivorans TaxID=88233 RepID=A0A0R1Q9J6_9LACO|nr:acetolactate synthase AlsS [Lacticaseibacillus manihotivorans]KRL37640.1 acetolactate synthase [Lacticaseibacillus manihotivorans DSM 13343 = JCM 12514]QFQ91955.1 acetolactate synthase AlsS [Lacticaseibacillus manihotivorans]